MTDFEADITEAVETGDWVIVNADEGYVEIIKRKKNRKPRRRLRREDGLSKTPHLQWVRGLTCRKSCGGQRFRS